MIYIALVPIETPLEEKKLAWTLKREKKTTYKEVTENSDVSSKNMKSESKKIN